MVEPHTRIVLIETPFTKMCELKRFKAFDYNVGYGIELQHFKLDNIITAFVEFQGVFQHQFHNKCCNAIEIVIQSNRTADRMNDTKQRLANSSSQMLQR